MLVPLSLLASLAIVCLSEARIYLLNLSISGCVMDIRALSTWTVISFHEDSSGSSRKNLLLHHQLWGRQGRLHTLEYFSNQMSSRCVRIATWLGVLRIVRPTNVSVRVNLHNFFEEQPHFPICVHKATTKIYSGHIQINKRGLS